MTAKVTTAKAESAEELVQRQVEAYNARSLERFLACYSETITIFRMPTDSPSMTGKPQLAEFYGTQRFNRPGLHAEILQRIVLGTKVVDHERVVGIRDTAIEMVAVYEVAQNLIERVWFFAPE